MDSTRISIARILALGVPLTWQDAVAVAQEAAMLSDVNAAMNSRPSLVSPETCFITRAGDLELPETTDDESPDAVAGLLRAMLGDSDAPDALRTLAADASSPDLSSELRAFAVGNRRTAIAQLAARALTLDAPTRATPKPPPVAPPPEPASAPEPPPAIASRRWAPMAPSAQPVAAVAMVPTPVAPTTTVAATPPAAPDVELRRLRQRAVDRDKRNPARARFARFLPTRANLPGPRAVGGAIVAVAAVAAVSAVVWPLARPYVSTRTAPSVTSLAQAAVVAPATTTNVAATNATPTPSPAPAAASVPVVAPATAAAARTPVPGGAASRPNTTTPSGTPGATVAVSRSASPVTAGPAARAATPPAANPGAPRATMSAAPPAASAAAVPAPPPAAVPAVSSAPTLAARPAPAPAEPAAALVSPPSAPVAAPAPARTTARPAAGTFAGRGGRAMPYSASDTDVAPPTLRSQQLPSSVLDPGPDAPVDGPFLTVLIDEHGAVERVRLHAKAPPSGQTLYRHRMMVAAAKAWRFEPARRQGEAVRYVLRVPLEP